MITFEVYLNGKLFTVAGNSALSVLTANLNAVGKLGADSYGTVHQAEDTHDLYLHVGGLTSNADRATNQHLRWRSPKTLKVGDEITVRIIEQDKARKPAASLPARTLDEELNEYEQVKKRYLQLKDKFEPKPALKKRRTK